MLQRKHRWRLAACGVMTAVVASAVATPSASASGDDRRTNADGRVIVPNGPGERARVVGPRSAYVARLAARTARSEQANQSDREFVEMMIPHHYQAIVMSRLAPKRSADERVRALAGRIRSEQNVEIESMQGWQGREGLPVINARASYQEMLGHPDMLEHMGMATRKEIKGLRAANGHAFDKRFVRLMIPHHKGAIAMAESAAGNGQDLFIRQLAIDMISAQSRQIYDMRQIRKSWG